MNLLTWQKPIWEHLWQPGIARIPHALLLVGSAGIGKLAFAKALSQSLLCQHRTVENHACGGCSSCHYFSQNGHPDFRLVAPEADDESQDSADGKEKKASELITIRQIRELGEFVSLTSHQSGPRVVLITKAEQLNVNAANALLKMLEEPPPHTIFLLVANHLSRILPTVRSRCRLVKMPMPNPAQASAWLDAQHCPEPELNLALAGRAPLDALANGENPEWQAQRKRFCDALARPTESDAIGLAESVLKIGPAIVIGWLQTWIYDLVSLRITELNRYHLDQIKSQISLNKKFQLIELLNFNSELSSAKRLIHHPLNLKLFWEFLFIKYFKLFS
jgi:DNA polymerase III subunit delta'